MSKQSNKNQYSGTEPEKTIKLFVQCFKEQTDKQFIVDGKGWRFAEPGIGHSKDGAHMTLIMSSALDALLVQQASHKHKGMIETGQVHCRTGYLGRAAGRNLRARGFEQIFVLGEDIWSRWLTTRSG